MHLVTHNTFSINSVPRSWYEVDLEILPAAKQVVQTHNTEVLSWIFILYGDSISNLLFQPFQHFLNNTGKARSYITVLTSTPSSSMFSRLSSKPGDSCIISLWVCSTSLFQHFAQVQWASFFTSFRVLYCQIYLLAPKNCPIPMIQFVFRYKLFTFKVLEFWCWYCALWTNLVFIFHFQFRFSVIVEFLKTHFQFEHCLVVLLTDRE